MQTPAYAIGQAVYIRTDTPDYVEEIMPFKTLEEMVEICSKAHDGMTLEKVIVYSLVEQEPCALTLGFVSASKGQRPNQPSEQPFS
jgi:hypothetical protein